MIGALPVRLEGSPVQFPREVEALFAVLREAAAHDAVSAMENLVRHGSDRALCRVNALDFAGREGVDEERMIEAFLHASHLGVFDLSWNVLCPGCSGVLDSGTSLKSVNQSSYNCALCAAGYEPTLDEMVEVTFTVSPRVRRIAAHDPQSLPQWEYYRQIFWGSGIQLPDDAAFERLSERVVLDEIEMMPGEKAVLSLTLPAEFIIIFDPVVHMAQFIDVKGEPTHQRQNLSFVLTKEHAPTGTAEMRPGPLRLSLENRTTTRTLPSIWIAGHELHELLGLRRPFLTGKRLLTNQTFRDLYRVDTIDVDQRLKITSLTFLFTDLKGSTELYDRVGDLAAYDIVRAHFRILHEVVAAEAGAVVKTIGDAVMATFPTPERAVRAALRMRETIRELREDLLLKIGIHEGACLAVMLNDRQDYFGQTVNIASRVQNLATTRSIFATGHVVEYAGAAELLRSSGIAPVAQQHLLRGITNELVVYEIP
jgi:class 3 adenylate cyclase